jgi:hypothetical protein
MIAWTPVARVADPRRRAPGKRGPMTEPSPRAPEDRDAVEPAGPPQRVAPSDADDERSNPFNSFALVVLLVLVVGGLWLVFRLKDISAVQDCVWSGRRNCAPVEPEAPVPLSK